MDSNNYLKIIYAQIINGYSSFDYKDKAYYIKHLNYFTSTELDLYREKIFSKAKEKGLRTNEQRLQELIGDKLWSAENEQNIKDYEISINHLKLTKTKLPLQKDRSRIETEIQSFYDKLLGLLIEKNKLLGLTAEKYTDKRVNEYYTFMTLYADGEFNKKAFSSEEYNDLEQNILDEIVHIYNERINIFNEHNLKRISLMPFFMNLLIASNENPYYFFGKPIIHLTFYQLDLFNYGKQFKNILNNSKIQPPVEILGDPDKLVDWFSSAEASETTLSLADENPPPDNGKENVLGGSSIVGANKEDYEKIGVDNSINKKLDEELKKKGEIGFEDFIKLHM